jgi:threonine synthase
VRKGLSQFYGGFADDAEALAAIGDLYGGEKYLIDTHTAVAYKVYLNYRDESGDGAPAVIASTASAYKFADTVAAAIGLGVEADGFANIRAVNERTGVKIPDALRNLEGKEVRHKGTVDAGEMMEAVEKALGLAGQAAQP